MNGPGEYVADVTEGIARVEDWPSAKIVKRSRNYTRRLRPEGSPRVGRRGADTHCGRSGWSTVFRRTIRKRLQAKLSAVRIELRRRRHAPIPVVGQWLPPAGICHPYRLGRIGVIN